MPGNTGAMPNYPPHQNNMYNGPSHGQMPPHAYNNMPMNSRSPNFPYGQQNNMSNQYGGFNQNGPGSGPPGTGPGPGPGMSPGTGSVGQTPSSTQNNSMNDSSGQAVSPTPAAQPGLVTPTVKGAQAAAQAALIAAANSAKPTPAGGVQSVNVRPTMPNQQPRMYGPPGGSEGSMNHVGFGGPNMHPNAMGPIGGSGQNVPNSHSPVPNSLPEVNSMSNDMGAPMSNNVPHSSPYPGSIDASNSAHSQQTAFPSSLSGSSSVPMDNVPQPPDSSGMNLSSSASDVRNSSMPSSSVHPSHSHNIHQHDSNSSSSSLSSASTAPLSEVSASNVNSANSIPSDQGQSEHRTDHSTTNQTSSSLNCDSVTKSHLESELSSDGDIKTNSQKLDYANSGGNNQIQQINQGGMTSSAKQEMPLTTTASNLNSGKKIIKFGVRLTTAI